MKVVIATNNKGKLEEFKQMLEPRGYEVSSLSDAGISIDIVEDGVTFEENAKIKATAIYNICKCPVIADDSGLEIEYLNNEPGVYSARYGGFGLDDFGRNDLVLNKLEKVPHDLRKARFVAVVFYIDGENTYFARGEVGGFIGLKPIGKNGFGYDPIFMVDENRSMAMLTNEEKNKISHRGMAIKNLLKELEI